MTALSSRWVQSRYSELIYHATLDNFKNPDKPMILELEGDPSGRVFASVRYAEEIVTPGGFDGFASFTEAARACLKEAQHMFQSRRGSFLVCEFMPYTTDREIKKAYGIAQSTANNWKNHNFREPMSRKSVNQIIASVGFRFGGKGSGIQDLGPAWWEETEGEENV